MEGLHLVIYVILCSLILSTESKTRQVLITGGAGFIGFHTAVKLAEKDDTKVVVLDIFDDSYSVDLKKARAGILKDKGVTVHSGDACSEQMLDHLFEENDFNEVLHLVSKDGQIESMEAPELFIKTNTECLLTLLRLLSSYKTIHLVYVSSYNVDNEDSQTGSMSLYTALKTGAERFVTAFCDENDISTVSVRPFNVYGPWGNPNGDVYRMALEMDKSNPVEVYSSNTESIIASRDYTYIDDAVDGIMAALSYRPEECGKVFNIASGAEPVSMETVYDFLKMNMNKDVEKEVKPLPLYEPLRTKGDITDTRNVLKYNPKVTMEEGVKEFITWFQDYHHDKKWNSPKPDDKLSSKLQEEKVMYVNKKYKQRLTAIRQEYEVKAADNGLPVTKYYEKNFLKFKGTTAGSSPRGSMKPTSVSILTDWCRIIDECVAFDSKGHFYSYIPQKKNWRSSTSDLYVADINVCEAGYTTCYGNCTCTYKGPSQAENSCPEGFGLLQKSEQQDFCYELYVKGKTTDKEKEFMILDEVEGRNWQEFIEKKSYVKFSNKYFDYGVVAYHPKAKNKVDELKAACDDTYHCIGFSTNGELKGIINHVHRWKKSEHDFYVRDVDYCLLHEEKCSCKRTHPGEYSCMGKKP